MRQDVKLGLAVGGVLLAVLIVYVLVVPGSEQPGAALAVDESAAESVSGGPGGDDTAAENDTSAADSAQQAARFSDASEAGTDAENTAVASNSSNTTGGFDWDKLLNGEGAGEIPSMSAETTVSAPQPPAEPAASDSAQPQAQETVVEQEAIAGPTDTIGQGPVTAPDSAVSQEPVSQEPAIQDAVATQQPVGSQGEVLAQPPPPGADMPTAPTPTRVHVIKPNETFSSIAAAVYGSPNFYPHIQRANPGIDPARLKPGMKISLPDVSAVKPAAITASSSSTGEQSFDPNQEYRVQPNDSLYRISVKLYGKSDRMNKLYELNKDKIGDDPADVKPGMVLKLPEVPTITASR